MSGLDEEQLGELEHRVAGLLDEPWDKGEGRPGELTLREALVVTCGYMRQNIIEDVWADIFDVAQSTISRYITFLRHLSKKRQKRTGRRQRRQPRLPGERSRW
jgi:Helix-turn-helix of DDE superfamily endonuclease